MLAVAFGRSAPWNETHWKNEKFEKLLDDARAETDEAKRKTYIWEMQAMLHERRRRADPRLPRLARRPQRKGRRPHARTAASTWTTASFSIRLG